jgi:hypothetical protein
MVSMCAVVGQQWPVGDQLVLSLVKVQILRGEWTDPERAKIKLSDYAARWIAHVQASALVPSISTAGCSGRT